jgi:hypothetical protein
MMSQHDWTLGLVYDQNTEVLKNNQAYFHMQTLGEESKERAKTDLPRNG